MKVVISEEGFKPQKDRHASIMFNYVQSITISVGIYFSAFFLVMRVGLGPIVFSHS
jgi:hypothetical protein